MIGNGRRSPNAELLLLLILLTLGLTFVVASAGFVGSAAVGTASAPAREDRASPVTVVTPVTVITQQTRIVPVTAVTPVIRVTAVTAVTVVRVTPTFTPTRPLG